MGHRMPCADAMPADATNHLRWWLMVKRTCKRGWGTSTHLQLFLLLSHGHIDVFTCSLTEIFTWRQHRYKGSESETQYPETPLCRTTFEVSGGCSQLIRTPLRICPELLTQSCPTPVLKLLLSSMILSFLGLPDPKSPRLRIHRSIGIIFQKCNKDKMQILHPIS